MSQPEPASEPATTTAADRAPAAYPQAIHVRPTAPLAERVLLPGDPGRALALAQTLLQKPLMFNHNRGLWGYTGAAHADGAPLTIQATGIGGPSAAIVLTELISLGARRLIRVGTCGALAPHIELGDLVVARESVCVDGTSRALSADARVPADPTLAEALVRNGRSRIGSARRPVHAGAIASVDLFYDDSDHRSPRHPDDVLAIEMEAAALFAVAATTPATASVSVACLLAVSDTFDAHGARTRIDDDSLLAAGEAMGTIAVTALPV